MTIFIVVNIFIGLFFAIVSFLALRSRYYYLFIFNVIGFFAVFMSLVLEHVGRQTKLSLLLLFFVFISVLGYNLVHIIKMLIHDYRYRYDLPETWNKFMQDRSYKIIYDDKIFNQEAEQLGDVGMTEKLQALQMWKLGNHAFLQNHLDDVLEKYDLSLKWLPNSVTWTNKSALYFEKGDYEQVQKCCEKAIKINPNREEAWINQGLMYLTRQDYRGALKSFENALQTNSENPEIFVLRGNTLRRLDRLQPALESYEKAIEIDQHFMEAWFQKGITLSAMNRYEEAISFFDYALSLAPKSALIHYHKGNTLNKLDQNEEAIQTYQKALKYDPDLPEAWNNMGIAHSKLGQLKESIKNYQHAIQLKSDYYEAWLNQALASESLKNYDKAVTAYKGFLKLAPESLSKHRNIAQKHLLDLEKIIQSSQTQKKEKKGIRKKDQSKKAGKKSKISKEDENKNPLEDDINQMDETKMLDSEAVDKSAKSSKD